MNFRNVCMFVCMFVCMYVCIKAMSLRTCLHIGRVTLVYSISAFRLHECQIDFTSLLGITLATGPSLCLFKPCKRVRYGDPPRRVMFSNVKALKILSAVLSAMATLAYTQGEIFGRYRANNGLMNEERTTWASDHPAQSMNLESSKENVICDTDNKHSINEKSLNCTSNNNAILLFNKFLVTAQS